MAALNYTIQHNGAEATIIFQSLHHGKVQINVKCVRTPDGNKGFVYDCVNATIGREIQQISLETDFVNDLSYIIYLYENSVGTKQDYINGTFDAVINKHIRQYGRIVDTDLYTTIAQMTIGLNALAQNEPNGVPLNEHGKLKLLKMLLARAEQKYGNFLYLTQYELTAYGLQPHLISFNDFKNNL